MLQNQINSLKAFSVQRNVKPSCPELLPAVDLSGPRIRPVGNPVRCVCESLQS